MDWASDDYTQVYADTFRSPPPESDAGVYLLDEAGRDSDPYTHAHRRAPVRRYGPPAGRREGYYTGGNIVSGRGNTRAVFDAAWDERPLHYNPHAGADWAHLVPPPLASRGPPAFPLRTQSEGLNNPGALQLPGAPSKECFAGGGCGSGGSGGCGCGGHSAELGLHLLGVMLLVIVVVLLAMSLAAAGRVARGLEKTARSAVALLGALAAGAPRGVA